MSGAFNEALPLYGKAKMRFLVHIKALTGPSNCNDVSVCGRFGLARGL
jgi:hypothetical protein